VSRRRWARCEPSPRSGSDAGCHRVRAATAGRLVVGAAGVGVVRRPGIAVAFALGVAAPAAATIAADGLDADADADAATVTAPGNPRHQRYVDTARPVC
jgi:uncharacterized protein (DUF1501 family)